MLKIWQYSVDNVQKLCEVFKLTFELRNAVNIFHCKFPCRSVRSWIFFFWVKNDDVSMILYWIVSTYIYFNCTSFRVHVCLFLSKFVKMRRKQYMYIPDCNIIFVQAAFIKIFPSSETCSGEWNPWVRWSIDSALGLI